MDKETQPAATEQGQASALEPDLTGQTLGDYRVLRRLGQGGMGQVYLAEQISLKRKVALKLLRSDLAANAVSLARFKNEARAVAQATHANIVQVYAIDEANGVHFMALEYVEGRNLREYLEKKGPPEILLALSIMRQVASALQRASELGIIHRDIKPENILLTRKGEAKVADFGLSRCFTEDGQPLNLTQAGVSMGTPLYMSPEQVECKPLDHRTDIYSFGVTCYHMLSGQPPFKGDNPFEVAVKHVQEMPVPLSRIRPDLPADLCALVHKMLAKKSAERIQTGREIVHELVRLRDALVGVSGTNLAISMGPAPSQPLDAESTQIIPSYRRRHLAWLGVLAVLLALGGGLFAGWLWNRPKATSATESDRVQVEAAQKQREKDLHARAMEHIKDGNPLQVAASLQPSIDLGLIYLKQRRLSEANQFFKELNQAGNNQQFRTWGKLGQAMVLAFQNNPAESFKQLQLVRIPEFKFKKANPFWINDPAIREVLAEALSFNIANAPDDFPTNLRRFLQPPQAVLKPVGK